MEGKMNNFVKNGVLRLPPGFRFHPTDEELVVQYLKRKVLSSPLPASIIPDVDVCKSDPWDLPGDKKQERYFFSTREAKYPNGNRSNRATVSGYWKATGKDKAVVVGGVKTNPNPNPNPNPLAVVGMKKTLVFYRGKPPHGSRTDWIMHEYRLAHTNQPPINPQPLKKKTGEAAAAAAATTTTTASDWVLCRIFLKKRSNAATQNDEEDEQGVVCEEHDNIACDTKPGKPIYYDFMSRDLNLPATCSSSSGSSAVTDMDIGDDTTNNTTTNTNTNIHHRHDTANDASSEERDDGSSSCNSIANLSTKL